MKRTRVTAPAKVNYRLEVLRRRPDGYHDLRMIMQRVDLCDDIDISVGGPAGIRVSCGSDQVPEGEGNIAWRAAKALLDLSPEKPGIDIAITKRIPVAAGLGGGSSDCASVLLGVNELLGLGLSKERLMEVGVNLGADVPFFIFGATALAEGIGERLTEIGMVPPAWIVLVNPRIEVSTAWVYRNLELTTRDPESTIPRFFDTVGDLCTILENDLESVTIPAHPVIGEIKDRLLAEGAAGALMSGSGATVFGVFESEDAARRAAAALGENGWFSAAVRTL